MRCDEMNKDSMHAVARFEDSYSTPVTQVFTRDNSAVSFSSSYKFVRHSSQRLKPLSDIRNRSCDGDSDLRLRSSDTAIMRLQGKTRLLAFLVLRVRVIL